MRQQIKASSITPEKPSNWPKSVLTLLQKQGVQNLENLRKILQNLVLEDLADDNQQPNLVLLDLESRKVVVLGNAVDQDIEPLAVLHLVHDEALHLSFRD